MLVSVRISHLKLETKMEPVENGTSKDHMARICSNPSHPSPFTDVKWSGSRTGTCLHIMPCSLRRRQKILICLSDQGPRVSATVRQKRKNHIKRHNIHTSPFNKLPDVLVIEILSRLPPKSFFRCRKVSKTWLSLSSDAVHLNKHLQPTLRGFFYNYPPCGARFVNLSHGINKVQVDRTLLCKDSFNILDCCNGLLLVQTSIKKSRFLHHLNVYNPATRTLFTLWSHERRPNLAFSVSLAFDPQVFHQFHVIRFNDNFLDIFSFEKGAYKHHKTLECDVRISNGSKGTFVDGRVHRLTTEAKILSVDPKNCSYEVIRRPNLKIKCALIEIGQSQGVLHCMYVSRDKRLFVWVLESYTKQEWTLKYQLSLDAMYQSLCDFNDFCIRRFRYYNHFAFHPDKDVLFMPKGMRSFVSLDLSTGKGDELYSMSDCKENCWVYMPCYLV
ncbi:F-box protein [Carex littledalei]|uniref:F-box protein n=1 Tax=Carex littledalei TaxID=544730 RepID=A0A833VQ01_9POAL|nr:F-box protein [Carex littledalei]